MENDVKKKNESTMQNEEIDGYSFWPTHVLSQAMLLVIFGGIVFTLAMLVPIGLLNPLDPLVKPDVVKPPWYLLPLFQFGKYVPKTITALVLPVGGLFLLLWPFIDRKIDEKFGKYIYWSIGTFVLLITLLLGIVGWASEKTIEFGGKKVFVDTFGLPHVSERNNKSTTDISEIPEQVGNVSKEGGDMEHED